MTTSESKGRFFYKTNRFQSIRITNRIESIRIPNWNALPQTEVRSRSEVGILQTPVCCVNSSIGIHCHVQNRAYGCQTSHISALVSRVPARPRPGEEFSRNLDTRLTGV